MQTGGALTTVVAPLHDNETRLSYKNRKYFLDMTISECQKEAQGKVLERFRLLAAALVLFLHLAFLLALKGMPLPRAPVHAPRLAPTVLVLLPSLQAQMTPQMRPERRLPIDPTPKERFSPLPITSPPAAASGPAVISPEAQTAAAPGPAAT